MSYADPNSGRAHQPGGQVSAPASKPKQSLDAVVDQSLTWVREPDMAPEDQGDAEPHAEPVAPKSDDGLPGTDLARLNKTQLRELAEQAGVDGHLEMTKAQLVDALAQ